MSQLLLVASGHAGSGRKGQVGGDKEHCVCWSSSVSEDTNQEWTFCSVCSHGANMRVSQQLGVIPNLEECIHMGMKENGNKTLVLFSVNLKFTFFCFFLFLHN